MTVHPSIASATVVDTLDGPHNAVTIAFTLDSGETVGTVTYHFGMDGASPTLDEAMPDILIEAERLDTALTALADAGLAEVNAAEMQALANPGDFAGRVGEQLV